MPVHLAIAVRVVMTTRDRPHRLDIPVEPPPQRVHHLIQPVSPSALPHPRDPLRLSANTPSIRNRTRTKSHSSNSARRCPPGTPPRIPPAPPRAPDTPCATARRSRTTPKRCARRRTCRAAAPRSATAQCYLYALSCQGSGGCSGRS